MSEMRQVPTDWKMIPISDICHLGRGRVISQIEINEHPGSYPVYSSQSKNEGIFGYLDTYDFEGEYVTWTTDGAYAGTVFYRSGRFNCTNVCGTLEAKADLSVKYLAYALSTRTRKHVSYIGNPKLMNNVMAEILVPLPPLPEQRRIADILDAADAAIRETERVIAKLRQVKRGLLHDLLTRGLDESGRLRDPHAHPEQFKDSLLGRIPRGWGIESLEAIGSQSRPYIKTGPFGSTLKSEHWVDEGVPVITIGSLGEGKFIEDELLFVTEDKAQSLQSYKVQSGDLVFSRVADVGRSVVVSDFEEGWIISSNLMRICIDESMAVPSFVYHNLVHSERTRQQIRQFVNAGGRDIINTTILDGLRFAWPSYKEQKQIVKAALAHDARIRAEEAVLAKRRQLKRGLMDDLLTGRVRA